MPKFLEQKLRTEASAKGKKGRAADRYVYGAMNNMGAMRGNQETAKGAEMEAKHDRKMTSQVHNYDHHRPKRQVVSRYAR